MAKFPILKFEPVVQVDDKTRLDASKSFVTPDESDITALKIDPDGSEGFIDVTTEQYLDWLYDASGSYTITLRVEAGAASASADVTGSISVVTVASDKLFSTDADLELHEPDIMKWVQNGRSSFLNIHRRAQTVILEWLKKEGYIDINGDYFTKADVVDIEEVKQWSTYLVLRLVFEGISNSTEDVFAEKAAKYLELEKEWRKRALLKLDTDGDGAVDDGEGIDPAYGFIARR